MECLKNSSKTLIMFFYLLIFAHLLINVSNSNAKWNINKNGENWTNTFQEGHSLLEIKTNFYNKSETIKPAISSFDRQNNDETIEIKEETNNKIKKILKKSFLQITPKLFLENRLENIENLFEKRKEEFDDVLILPKFNEDEFSFDTEYTIDIFKESEENDECSKNKPIHQNSNHKLSKKKHSRKKHSKNNYHKKKVSKDECLNESHSKEKHSNHTHSKKKHPKHSYSNKTHCNHKHTHHKNHSNNKNAPHKNLYKKNFKHEIKSHSDNNEESEVFNNSSKEHQSYLPLEENYDFLNSESSKLHSEDIKNYEDEILNKTKLKIDSDYNTTENENYNSSEQRKNESNSSKIYNDSHIIKKEKNNKKKHDKKNSLKIKYIYNSTEENNHTNSLYEDNLDEANKKVKYKKNKHVNKNTKKKNNKSKKSNKNKYSTYYNHNISHLSSNISANMKNSSEYIDINNTIQSTNKNKTYRLKDNNYFNDSSTNQTEYYENTIKENISKFDNHEISKQFDKKEKYNISLSIEDISLKNNNISHRDDKNFRDDEENNTSSNNFHLIKDEKNFSDYKHNKISSKNYSIIDKINNTDDEESMIILKKYKSSKKKNFNKNKNTHYPIKKNKISKKSKNKINKQKNFSPNFNKNISYEIIQNITTYGKINTVENISSSEDFSSNENIKADDDYRTKNYTNNENHSTCNNEIKILNDKNNFTNNKNIIKIIYNDSQIINENNNAENSSHQICSNKTTENKNKKKIVRKRHKYFYNKPNFRNKKKSFNESISNFEKKNISEKYFPEDPYKIINENYFNKTLSLNETFEILPNNSIKICSIVPYKNISQNQFNKNLVLNNSKIEGYDSLLKGNNNSIEIDNEKKANKNTKIIKKSPYNKFHNLKISESENDKDRLFKLANIIFIDLIEELQKVDDINKKIYKNDNTILYLGSFIKITEKSLAEIIKIILDIDNSDYFKTIESKILLEEKIIKRLIIKLYAENYDIYKDENIIFENNSNFNFSKIIQYQNKFDEKSLNKIINEIINYAPIVLLNNTDQRIITSFEFDLNDFISKYNSYSNENFKVKNITKDFDEIEKLKIYFEENLFFLNENSKSSGNIKEIIKTEKENLQNEMDGIIYGPKIQEKMGSNLIYIAGQGRRAINQDGIIDKTPIFDVNLWPETCKTGLQSPVNILGPYSKEKNNLKLNFSTLKGVSEIKNDGFKLILSNKNLGTVYLNNQDYLMNKLEIHYPSEHTLGENEERSPLEFQIIGENSNKTKTIALSFLFEYDKIDNDILTAMGFGLENPLIGLKLRNNENVVINHESIDVKIDLGKYFNDKKNYVTYIGSLTSPPCTQGVQWFIFLEKLKATKKQINYFPILFGRQVNIRGLQPILDRQFNSNTQ